MTADNVIALDGSCNALKPCRACGAKQATYVPHHFHPYRLDCVECGRFHGWLGKFDAMRNGLSVDPDVLLIE